MRGMPFLVSLFGFLASVLLVDELACAIAFAPAAVRALATARRGGEEFQKGREATLERVEEFFHGFSIAQAVPASKQKRTLQAFVTCKKEGQYFET